MRYTMLFILVLAFTIFGLLSCNSGKENGEDDEHGERIELTSFEQTHGIGPVTEEMNIPDEIDPELVEQGERIYRSRCSSCHRMEDRRVGPPLGTITETRSPEWIMNFTLNPGENVNRHPRGQALLREYLTQMNNQNVDEDQVRAILEYLRYEADQR